jgi:hypothetical protein
MTMLCAFLAQHWGVIVPLLGALVTFLAKPRTPEQYAAIAEFSPALAKGLRLWAAIFPDLVKAEKILRESGAAKRGAS